MLDFLDQQSSPFKPGFNQGVYLKSWSVFQKDEFSRKQLSFTFEKDGKVKYYPIRIPHLPKGQEKIKATAVQIAIKCLFQLVTQYVDKDVVKQRMEKSLEKQGYNPTIAELPLHDETAITNIFIKLFEDTTQLLDDSVHKIPGTLVLGYVPANEYLVTPDFGKGNVYHIPFYVKDEPQFPNDPHFSMTSFKSGESSSPTNSGSADSGATDDW